MFDKHDKINDNMINMIGKKILKDEQDETNGVKCFTRMEQDNLSELSASEDDYSYENMMQSMKNLQKEAIKNGTADMSLEEINKEIYG